jgi:peptidoglycan biosynthesis protein MviN/MurJ (putative lipid II flippase)
MLMLGPVQFLKSIRRNNIQAHRVVGYLYFLMLYPASAGALWLSFYAFSGLPALLGFASLAAGWVATGYLAFVAVKEKRIQDHKEWMLRNYAMTYAAVSLRVMLVINLATNGGRPTETGYAVISWACWVMNLIIMEVWIRFVERASPPASEPSAKPSSTDS